MRIFSRGFPWGRGREEAPPLTRGVRIFARDGFPQAWTVVRIDAWEGEGMAALRTVSKKHVRTTCASASVTPKTKVASPRPHERVRMALPSKGRMAEDTLELLKVRDEREEERSETYAMCSLAVPKRPVPTFRDMKKIRREIQEPKR